MTPAELAAMPEEHARLAEGALLRADRLVAGYLPEVDILRGCDFFLRDGEIVGIIGPNGAGKSTLLKALFGLIPVRAGSVTLRGEDITSAPAHVLVTKGVGYVPQNNNVFPSLTIEENLEMGVYLRRKKFAERFALVSELFPLLAERRRVKAGALSGGERQMVAMGRALMMEPSVLLLDEPSAGLSPMFQDDVFIRCKQINAAGCLGDHGRAERPALSAGLRPRLRPGPGGQRLHRHREQPNARSQGDRALPGNPRRKPRELKARDSSRGFAAAQFSTASTMMKSLVFSALFSSNSRLPYEPIDGSPAGPNASLPVTPS